MPRSSNAPGQDVPKMEFIGLEVSVIPLGASGIVVDETKNTFRIRSAEREVTVPKPGNRFTFRLPGAREVTLAGEAIAYRPEDRIKRAGRR